MAEKQVVPYQEKKNSKKTQIRKMFDKISSNYDVLNRIISGGIDILWRKKVVSLLIPEKPKKNSRCSYRHWRFSDRID